MKPRSVHQVLAALAYGDAIGNEALAIQKHLRSRGYDSRIFAEKVHPKMAGFARPLSEYDAATDGSTLCLFHFSIGSAASSIVFHGREPVICVYHNITPAEFFFDFHHHLARLCHHGKRELGAFAARSVLGLGDSEFNRLELVAAGFERTGVLPIVLDWSRYDIEPSAVMEQRLGGFSGRTILFVGRVVPNKKVEDVIASFAAYQRACEPKSRLLLVGDTTGHETYLRRLRESVHDLRVRDVIFTGQVSQGDLVAAYRAADAFLCLSEHEGFCVPLLEAMRFDVPVIAYDAGAVSETMADGGLLLTDKDPAFVAALLDRVIKDESLRRTVVASGRARIEVFRKQDFAALLEAHIDVAVKAAGVLA